MEHFYGLLGNLLASLAVLFEYAAQKLEIFVRVLVDHHYSFRMPCTVYAVECHIKPTYVFQCQSICETSLLEQSTASYML